MESKKINSYKASDSDVENKKETLDIRVRFNTDFKEGDGSMEWRILINGVQYFTNEIRFSKKDVVTTKDFIEGVGEKWHIGCVSYLVEEWIDNEKTFFIIY